MVRSIPRFGLVPALVAAASCLVLAAADPVQPPRLSSDELAIRKRMAGNDPVQLLLLTPAANEADAKRLRAEINLILRQFRPTVDGEAVFQLSKRFAESVPRTASPLEVQELLGIAKSSSRQILYRRYIEQWVYDSPLTLSVVFEHPKGQEPHLYLVRAEKP